MQPQSPPQRIRSKFYVRAHNIYCEVQYFPLETEFLFQLWTGVKGKVLSVQATETHLRSGIINLLIRKLNHRELDGGEWSYSPSGLKSGQPFYWRLERHHNRTGLLGEEKNVTSAVNWTTTCRNEGCSLSTAQASMKLIVSDP